ncbi:HEXXH motif domain-containing protein [Amycolatopsis sp. NBRC 101858]|uniref:aKG-HExxH-type peptide beta-hydroxylase n=1 Tax=Amycolatopsis sp. NBRC 101858 TaxID=3032200 RepID=UPI0024A32792|nr:HEXXH motif-containing putative peptide modification protein [Amycolatopsis sp. NBRC 101858]GLY34815.1 HEXXH motif domain-containing protein [Amycolatopsis sp. NBRC 101858]
MPTPCSTVPEPAEHTLPWSVFDQLSRGEGGAEGVRALRAAERSRRLLLLRWLIDEAENALGTAQPLPSPEAAWDLLSQAEAAAPDAVNTVLAHPYTGFWAGYATRMLHEQLTPAQPPWAIIGHVHALAAAAAIRAGLDFAVEVPAWQGRVALPTLGLAQLTHPDTFSVAQVRSHHGIVCIANDHGSVTVPADRAADTAGWSGIRPVAPVTGAAVLKLRIDDLDPYRGLFEPIGPDRLSTEAFEAWRGMLSRAWRLIVDHLPEFAAALPAGLDSIVPAPAVPFRLPSASTGEAFGSAVIAEPDDPAQLAAALVHEFHHIRLGGLLHLVRLHNDDRTERLYAPWREDPRPLGGVVHGIYAFFGVTWCWMAFSAAAPDDRLAAFEFAHWRGQTWRTLLTVRDDPALTDAGRRFLDGIAERLGLWQDEPVQTVAARWADNLAADHYAGWRARHLRPALDTVKELVSAWLAGDAQPPAVDLTGSVVLDTVSDGAWENARADLVRLALGEHGEARLAELWHRVPGAVRADYAYVDGRTEDAVAGYRAVLETDPDDPAALVGLGLTLSEKDSAAARALLGCPELVRAVHRDLRAGTAVPPAVEELAAWIGRVPA